MDEAKKFRYIEAKCPTKGSSLHILTLFWHTEEYTIQTTDGNPIRACRGRKSRTTNICTWYIIVNIFVLSTLLLMDEIK
jgi:hypothetical protein